MRKGRKAAQSAEWLSQLYLEMTSCRLSGAPACAESTLPGPWTLEETSIQPVVRFVVWPNELRDARTTVWFEGKSDGCRSARST